VLLYAIVHLTYGFIKYALEKKYASKENQLEVNNASAITNLSHVDIAIFSLQGAFISPESVQIIRERYQSICQIT